MFGWTLAVARLKCPQCRKGDIYIKKNLFAIKDGHKMNKQCSHCELEFEPEPGYYYGAMYVSYMLNVAFFFTYVLGLCYLVERYGPRRSVILFCCHRNYVVSIFSIFLPTIPSFISRLFCKV